MHQKEKISQEQIQERWIWGILLLLSYMAIIGLIGKLKVRKSIK
ncbi:MAG: hypothetical protein MRERV_60c005 [Mycoplasmataceae bacterium RV_VA103A]|nr:MAG: hypothetical protein MRERV_60c005 [Mycoplasmataceae bacterium RV_VA103A]